MGAVPLFDRETSREYLGADVTHMFLPLLLIVKNLASEVMLIQRNEMRLASSDGDEFQPITWEQMARKFTYATNDPDAWSPGGASRARNPDSSMAQLWRQRAFPLEHMLRQQKKVGGFVYFSRGSGTTRFTLTVDALRMGSQRTQKLTLLLPDPPHPDDV